MIEGDGIYGMPLFVNLMTLLASPFFSIDKAVISKHKIRGISITHPTKNY